MIPTETVLVQKHVFAMLTKSASSRIHASEFEILFCNQRNLILSSSISYENHCVEFFPQDLKLVAVLVQSVDHSSPSLQLEK